MLFASCSALLGTDVSIPAGILGPFSHSWKCLIKAVFHVKRNKCPVRAEPLVVPCPGTVCGLPRQCSVIFTESSISFQRRGLSRNAPELRSGPSACDPARYVARLQCEFVAGTGDNRNAIPAATRCKLWASTMTAEASAWRSTAGLSRCHRTRSHLHLLRTTVDGPRANGFRGPST